MTTIERLWDKAKDDPEQRAIQEAIQGKWVLVCNSCGGESVRNGATGCYTCRDCGEQTHGDS